MLPAEQQAIVKALGRTWATSKPSLPSPMMATLSPLPTSCGAGAGRQCHQHPLKAFKSVVRRHRRPRDGNVQAAAMVDFLQTIHDISRAFMQLRCNEFCEL